MFQGNRKLEQPENYVAKNAEEERTRLIVLDTQARFIRDELSEEEVTDLKKWLHADGIFEQWEHKKRFARKLAVEQKIELLKIRKQLKNILCGAKNCSENTKRFRPGKEKSTLRKFMKKIDKVKKQYLRTGGGHSGWYDLAKSVGDEFSCGKFLG